MRYIVEVRTGIIAIHDTENKEYKESEDCTGQEPYTVHYWNGKRIEEEEGTYWTLLPKDIMEACELCKDLNNA